MNLEEDIKKLKESYDNASASKNKDLLYADLLEKYRAALEKIVDLQSELTKKNKDTLPSKSDVEAMSSMVDLISKLDDSVIEKLNKFGSKK